MKYCRFQHHDGEQYGLVESVAGREEITRLLATPPEDVGGDMERPANHADGSHPPGGSGVAAPGPSVEDRVRGAQLPRACRELGHKLPTEPLIFFKPTPH